MRKNANNKNIINEKRFAESNKWKKKRKKNKYTLGTLTTGPDLFHYTIKTVLRSFHVALTRPSQQTWMCACMCNFECKSRWSVVCLVCFDSIWRRFCNFPKNAWNREENHPGSKSIFHTNFRLQVFMCAHFGHTSIVTMSLRVDWL